MDSGKLCCVFTHLPLKHHLISFSVLDLVVEILRQLQTSVNVSLKANSALLKTKDP